MQFRNLAAVTALTLFSKAQADCHHDNCLRALIGASSSALAFCAAYTPEPTADPDALASSIIASISASGVTGTYTATQAQCTTTAVPHFLAPCSEVTQTASACSCLVTASATSSPTSTFTTKVSSSSTAPTTSPTAGCGTNSNWPGWSGIKKAFVFGDSYTSTGFNVTGIQPSPTNPLGNPPYPGWTSSNGPNWVDYLTVKYNASQLLTYNIAYGGATIDSTLVAPYLPTVSSVAEQVENEWFPAYASGSWDAASTLFAFFDGINDVGNSWWLDNTAMTSLYNSIFAVYRGLVDELYNAGARNFLFVDVPPVDRSPLALPNTPDQIAAEHAALLRWNGLLADMAKAVKKDLAGVNVFTVSAWDLFTQVLDSPASYAETAGYKNVTAYCAAYQNGTPDPQTFDPSCGIPVNEYFWLNSLHPTYPMQDVLAKGVAKVLGSGVAVC